MKKNLTMSITLSIVLVFVVSGIGSIVSVSANDPMNLQPYDVGASLRKTNYQIKSQETYRHRELTGKSDDEGIFLEWAILDDWEGAYYYAIYELRAIGDLCEIWVQVDMAYPEGDPRDTPVVTDAQAEYLLAEFEGNIYPIDTDYFGTPDFHDGSKPSLHGSDWADDTGRSVILVSNVRDESYYDSSYPYYIAGFYSPTFEEFFDRNIISMYAEPLCGYPLAWGDIDSYLATPDNSLVDWGDQGGINILADYGNALMWAIYLSDNYGTDFLSQFVQAGIVGIDGINAALDHFGHEDTFDDAFHGWRIANLIDSGEYAYDFMDLSETDPPRIYDLYSTSA
ncbi:MAG: hypothetical protein ACTSRX_10520, partial [Promethearchaeota archaeon]